MRLFEIFRSISGETCQVGQGKITTFIRLSGCNIDCRWCDTRYAATHDAGEKLSWPSLYERIKYMKSKHILLTGGEPLLQITQEHINDLLQLDTPITIETNGTIKWDFVRSYGLSFVVDYKLPSSGMTTRMLPVEDFLTLTEHDYVKFVIANIDDLALAIGLLMTVWKGRRFTPVFSPMLNISHVKDPGKSSLDEMIMDYIKSPLDEMIMDYIISPQKIYDLLIDRGILDAIITCQLHKIMQLQ